MRLLLALLFAVAAHAQVTASFSRQPLEVFRAAFGAKLKNVSVYQATVCNAGPQLVTLHSGRVVQAAQTRFGVVDEALVEATIMRARRHSKTYYIARIAEYGIMTAAILTASGTIAANVNVKTGIAVSTTIADKLVHSLDGQQVTVGGFLSGMLALPPGSCESRILLGAFRPDVTTFEVTIQ